MCDGIYVGQWARLKWIQKHENRCFSPPHLSPRSLSDSARNFTSKTMRKLPQISYTEESSDDDNIMQNFIQSSHSSHIFHFLAFTLLLVVFFPIFFPLFWIFQPRWRFLFFSTFFFVSAKAKTLVWNRVEREEKRKNVKSERQSRGDMMIKMIYTTYSMFRFWLNE